MVLVGRMDFDHVSAHPEGAAAQVLAAFVLNVHEAAQQRLARGALPRFQHDQHAVISFGRTQTINAGDRGHDHPSRRSKSERVALMRNWSSSSLIVDSFSM